MPWPGSAGPAGRGERRTAALRGQQRGVLAAALIAGALAGLFVCVPHLLPAGFLRAARDCRRWSACARWRRRRSWPPRW
ncbi:hypothetical protein V2I01_13705 [Micromonospora sp. BRA006-A]|nr:hypothetical protein [Micromonospora sp. BRA006-A]